MRIRLLKLIDKIFGWLFPYAFLRMPGTPFRILSSILIIRPGGIGDAVLLLPTIQALKNTFPNAAIYILAEKRNSAVFFMSPFIKRTFCYDKPFELFNALKDDYDVVIDTEQWHHLSAVVAKLTKAPVLIGFATNSRERAFTHPVPYSHADYELKSFMNLLLPLAVPVNSDSTPFLAISDNSAARARKLLGSLEDKSFVTIFPGASISEKCWNVEKFKQLASSINSIGIPIVILGDKECMDDGQKIISDSYSNLNLGGGTSLLEASAILAKSLLLVSGDSGLLHMAMGFGTATVSLFGPSNTKKWAPKGNEHISISKNLACSPCSKFGYTPTCQINAKCMSDITVDEVFDAVLRLLEKTGNLPQKGK